MFGLGFGFNNVGVSRPPEAPKVTNVSSTPSSSITCSNVSSAVVTGAKAMARYEAGKHNQTYRERTELENKIRVIAGSGALGKHIQTATIVSEVGETIMHENIKANIEMNNMIYDNCIKAGMTDDEAKDIIFRRATDVP
jgi:hypothetical protein